jgi:hypothetical protein
VWLFVLGEHDADRPVGLAMENILRHKTTDQFDFQALANLKSHPKTKKKFALKAKKRK